MKVYIIQCLSNRDFIEENHKIFKNKDDALNLFNRWVEENKSDEWEEIEEYLNNPNNKTVSFIDDYGCIDINFNIEDVE